MVFSGAAEPGGKLVSRGTDIITNLPIFVLLFDNELSEEE